MSGEANDALWRGKHSGQVLARNRDQAVTPEERTLGKRWGNRLAWMEHGSPTRTVFTFGILAGAVVGTVLKWIF